MEKTFVRMLVLPLLLGLGCQKQRPPEPAAPPAPRSEAPSPPVSRAEPAPRAARSGIPREIDDLRRLVRDVRASDDPAHPQLVEALLGTAAAIESLGQLPDDAFPDLKAIREDAQRIRDSAATSMRHAAYARDALSHAANALDAIGRDDRDLDGLVGRAEDVREAATEIRDGTPLVDQHEAVADGLDEVVEALIWAAERRFDVGS